MKLFTAIAMWLATMSSVLAADPAGSTEIGKWWKDSEVVMGLSLTDAQVNKIEQIFLGYRSRLSQLNSELKNREAELSTLMNTDSLDQTKVRSATDRAAMSRAELEKANGAMMIAIRQELSKNQWNRLQEIRKLRESSAAITAPGGPPKQITPFGEPVYSIGGSVKAPRILFQPKPQYTQAARDAMVGGIVVVQGIVRKNGHVTELKILQGLGYGLDQSTIRTIGSEWRFEPGTLNGQPVNVQVNIEVSFRIQ
jgi:TonB family protein